MRCQLADAGARGRDPDDIPEHLGDIPSPHTRPALLIARKPAISRSSAIRCRYPRFVAGKFATHLAILRALPLEDAEVLMDLAAHLLLNYGGNAG